MTATIRMQAVDAEGKTADADATEQRADRDGEEEENLGSVRRDVLNARLMCDPNSFSCGAEFVGR